MAWLQTHPRAAQAAQILAAALSCLVSSYQAAFNSSSAALWSISILLDAVVIVDLVAASLHLNKSARVTPGHGNRAADMQRKEKDGGHICTDNGVCFVDPFAHVGKEYLRKYKFKHFTLVLSWYHAISMLSLVPFEVLSPGLAYATAMTSPEAVATVRLLRCIRVVGAVLIIDGLSRDIHASTWAVHAIKITVSSLTSAHLMACGWYALHCFQGVCDASGWPANTDPSLIGMTPLKQYITCLYFATITLTTTGYGDIRAYTTMEQWVCVGGMLYGSLLFGYLLADITSTLTNQDASACHVRQVLQGTQRWLNGETTVEPSLTARIAAYMTAQWTNSEATVASVFLPGLPAAVATSTAFELHYRMLRGSAAFADLNDAVLRTICAHLEPQLYLKGESMAAVGSKQSSMFFVERGVVHVLDAHGTVHFVAGAGSTLGCVPLILNLCRTTSLMAHTDCQVYVLNKADLNQITSCYPEAAARMEAYAWQTVRDAAALADSVATSVELLSESPVGVEPAAQCVGAASQHALACGFALLCTLEAAFAMFLVCTLTFTISVWHPGHAYLEPISSAAVASSVSWAWGAAIVLDLCTISAARNMSRCKFLKGWVMYTTVVGLLPVDCVGLSVFGLGMEAAWMRLNRVLLLATAATVLLMVFKRVTMSHRIDTVRAASLTAMMALFLHTASCVWYWLACPWGNCEASEVLNWQHTTPFGPSYLASLYWSITTSTTTGYGDIHATTMVEQFVAAGVAFAGVLLFGFALGVMAASMTNNDLLSVQFIEKRDGVDRFLADHAVPLPLRQRARRYMHARLQLERGLPKAELLRSMPSYLGIELATALYKPSLVKFPLLAHYNDDKGSHLCTSVGVSVLMPQDLVFHRGDIGSNMLFIRRGYLDVTDDIDGQASARLGPGRYIGEFAMLFKQRRSCSVRAATFCEVLSLDAAVFLDYADPSLKAELRSSMNKELFTSCVQRVTSAAETKRRSSLPSLAHIASESAGLPAKRSSHALHDRLFPIISENEQPIDEGQMPLQQPHHSRHLLHGLLDSVQGLAQKHILAIQACNWLLAYATSILIPIQAAFLWHSVPLLCVSIMMDVLVASIWLLRRSRGHDGHERGRLEGEPLPHIVHGGHPVAWRNAEFWWTLMGNVPLELLSLLVVSRTGALRVVCWMRCNRVLRFRSVTTAFDSLHRQRKHSTAVITTLQFLVFLPVLTHLAACLWLALGCQPDDVLGECIPSGWIAEWSSSPDLGRHYLDAVYWATVTLATVGYGDIHATTRPEMVVALLVMLTGTLFYGYFVGTMSASLANADSLKARYKERMAATKRFLELHGVTAAVQQRAMAHYEHVWSRNRGVDGGALFDELSETLRGDLSLAIYRDAISAVPLFANKDATFIRLLSTMMKPLLLMKNEYVVRKGDFGDAMFFVYRGQVDVVSADGGTVFASMHAGDYFGEVSLVFSCPRTASIRAASACDLFSLSKADLDHVLQNFPDIAAQIRLDAEQRANLAKARAAAAPPAPVASKSRVSLPAVTPSTKHAGSEAQAGSTVTAKVEATAIPIGSNNPTTSTVASRTKRTALGRAHGSNQSAVKAAVRIVVSSPEGKDIFEQEPPSAATAISFNRSEGKHVGRAQTPILISCLMIVLSRFRTAAFRIRARLRALSSAWLVDAVAVIFALAIPFLIAFPSLRWRLQGLNCVLEAALLLSALHSFLSQRRSTPGFGGCQMVWRSLVQARARHASVLGFGLDLLCFSPLDLLATVAAFADESSRATCLTVAAVLRLARLWLLRPVFRRLSHNEQELHTSVFRLRCLKFVIIVLLVSHTLACAYSVIGCPEDRCSSTGWTSLLSDDDEADVVGRYSSSMYFVMATVTTTGFGDLTPQRVGEKVFVCFAIVMGKVLFASIIGNVAAVLANAAYQQTQFVQHVRQVAQSLRLRGATDVMVASIKRMYECQWKRTATLSALTIKEDLPATLASEIFEQAGRKCMKLFKVLAKCAPSTITAVASELVPQFLPPNQVIFLRGERVTYIHLIVKGVISSVGPENETSGYLSNGMSVGAWEGVCGQEMSTTMRTVTTVETMALPVHILTRLRALDPVLDANITSAAR